MIRALFDSISVVKERESCSFCYNQHLYICRRNFATLPSPPYFSFSFVLFENTRLIFASKAFLSNLKGYPTQRNGRENVVHALSLFANTTTKKNIHHSYASASREGEYAVVLGGGEEMPRVRAALFSGDVLHEEVRRED
jgi:hypothetical protein